MCRSWNLGYGCVLFSAWALSLIAASSAHAAIVANWNVAGGGSWNTGANWASTAVPGPTENPHFGSVIPVGTHAVTLDGNQTVYGVSSHPGSGGKTVQVNAGTGGTLTVLSTDATADNVSTFYAMSVLSGTYQLAPTLQLGDGTTTSSVATFNSSVNASNFVINGAITQAAGQTWGVRIVGNGTGIVNYATTAKAYSGDTTIATNGILKINTDNMVPDGAGRGNLVIEGSGQFQLNNTNETVNGLSSTSATAIVSKSGSNTRTFTFGNNNATATYVGSITLSGGTSAVSKIGGGTQTIGGNVTTAGTSSVTGGTLIANGTWNNGINVNTGGTLGGVGTIGGTTTIATAGAGGTAGTLAPGNSVGTIALNNLTINQNGVLAFELNGANTSVGGSANDLATVAGTLTLDGTLNVSEAVPGSFLLATPGQQWRLINYSGALTNNTLNIGVMPTLASLDYFLTIDASIAGQINLLLNTSAVPESSALLCVALAGCVGWGGAVCRRRWASKKA